jgi:uncharacterized membrane protein
LLHLGRRLRRWPAPKTRRQRPCRTGAAGSLHAGKHQRRRRRERTAAPPPVNPALLQHAKQRRQSLENRLADQITRFAGSMRFVYLHVIWFATWIGFRVEPYPFGLLTMIVSLEAIFCRRL